MGDLDFEELDKAVNNLMGKAAGIESENTMLKTISIDSTLKPGEGPNHGMVQAVANGAGGGITDAQRSVMQNLQATPSPDPTSSTDPAVAADAVAFTGPIAPNPASYSPAPTDSTDPSVPVAPTTPADPVIPATPVSLPEPEPASSMPTITEQPKPTVPRPSSGRFMDVVHPSSDMKLQSGPALVVPTREEMSGLQSPAASSYGTLTAPSVGGPAVSESASSETSPVAQDTAPLTPFLPDANAKVEKRPLGSTPELEKATDPTEPEVAEISSKPGVPVESLFTQPFKSLDDTNEESDESQPINGEFDRSVSKSENGENQRPIDPTSVILPMPAEDKALQSIESAEVAGADSKQDEPASTIAPIVDSKQEAVRAVESGDTGHLSSGTSAVGSNGAEPSDDKTGDIFDVKNNHHPAIHPVKQRSGWLTVIIVVLVIVVCVGIAAAAYYILGLGV